MQITLTSKEFDEAVSLWLQDQGFSTSTHSISTRVIAGRSDGPLGTRVEVTLEPKPAGKSIPVFEAMGIVDGGVGPVPMPTDTGTTRRFGQGHANE